MSDVSHSVEQRAPGGFGRELGRRAVERAVRSTTIYVLIALIAIVMVFALITPTGTFLSSFNLQTIANDASIVLLFAVGSTLVIISGGIDLSVGSIATFGGVLTVIVMDEVLERGGSPWLAIAVGAAAGIGSGALWGAINGWLVAYGKLEPFVVTLGSFMAALGAARLMTSGNPISGGPEELTDAIGLGTVAGIPVPFLIAVVAALIFGVALAQTRAGEHLYLVGSNEEAARRSGVNVRRQYFSVYMWSGALAGVAGVVTVARFAGESVATGHITSLITAIAGVVIGGASLVGGVGLMLGTVIGVFIPTVLNNGLIIMQVERFWQEVAVGIILVAAVGFDRWRRAKDLET